MKKLNYYIILYYAQNFIFYGRIIFIILIVILRFFIIKKKKNCNDFIYLGINYLFIYYINLLVKAILRKRK